MFGKRKYHRGRIGVRRQCWVLGGIVRETVEIFLETCKDNKRDKPTLEEIIVRRVKKGTHVITDCWAAYGGLEELGYTHSTVNHSLHFKDPITGAHSNTIEGRWFCVKRQLPRSGAYELESYLFVYMWRELVKREQGDHYTSFLALLASKREEETPEEEVPEFFLEMETPLWDCVFCGLELDTKEEQRRHVQKSCLGKTAWDFFCVFCGLEFETKAGLKVHTTRWCEAKK